MAGRLNDAYLRAVARVVGSRKFWDWKAPRFRDRTARDPDIIGAEALTKSLVRRTSTSKVDH